MKIKQVLQNILSIGITPEMDEEEKVAIRAAILINLGASGSYFANGIYAYHFNLGILLWIDIITCVALAYCLYLHHIKKHTLAKISAHVVASGMVAICGDMVRTNYEMYLFIGMINPFMFFSPKDYKKAFLASLFIGCILILQVVIGKENIRPFIDVPEMNITMMLFTVFFFLGLVMGLGLYYTKRIQDDVERKQKELIHSSSIHSLGAMMGNIAFEINTPLQVLTFNAESIKRQVSTLNFNRTRVQEQIKTMDTIIDKIARLISEVLKLTRKTVNDPVSHFSLDEMINSVLVVCERRVTYQGVNLSIQVDSGLRVTGQVGQVSQVLLNLLTNSLEATSLVNEKWIQIKSEVINDHIQLKITDSGVSAQQEIKEKMIDGRGLGTSLDISQGIMEKMGGRLIYEAQSFNTQFIMEFPTRA